MLNVLASVSQWEREAIGERTREALRHKRARGERVGRVRYGYRLAEDGVREVPEPTEQKVLEIARQARGEGLSLRAIARELASQGFRTRTGRGFHATQVRRMLAA